MGQCYSWKNIKSDTFQDFSYRNKKFYVKIVSLYDGDTGRMVFRDNLRMIQYKFRLYGVDTPEMKPLMSLPNRDEEIKKAKKAKEFLEKEILNKVVYVECLDFDKYGRILVKIYPSKSSKDLINQKLIEKGFGKSYFGGTK
jgi:endonuclease YncB( thermonuclease family)